MQKDKKITIIVGESRKPVRWQRQAFQLSELYDRLRVPARSAETCAAYLAMKKPQQDDLKNVGGFVGGMLAGARRKANAVIGRDLVTLDLDNLPPGRAGTVLQRLTGLGCGYCVHSTRKHAPEAPRLRAIVPLDRTEREMLLEVDGETIGAVYDANHAVHEIHGCKMAAFLELIEALQGKPALVFYSFRHERDRIMAVMLAVSGAVGLLRSREALQWLLAGAAWAMAVLIWTMED